VNLAADICMIVHNDVSHDSRVLKEATSLAAHGYRVVVVGVTLKEHNLPELEEVSGFTIWRVKPPLMRFRALGRMSMLLAVLLAWITVNRRLRQVKPQIYHAHDFTGLFQLATAGLWRRKIVYDSHELFFDRPFADVITPIRLMIYALRPVEKILARRAIGFITVSNHIANRLTQTLGIPRPVVLYNAVDLRRLAPCAVQYPANGRRVIGHTGNIVDTRHLPELVKALSQLPEDIALVLMGEGPLKSHLVAQAQALGIEDRLIVVPPVPPAAVAPTLAQADVAAVLTTSTILNHNLSIGNKFFEAIAAGLPLVTGPNAEISQLMREYELGVICNPSDPTSIADAIRTLLQPENQSRYQENALKAREVLNWETQERKLVELYHSILPLSG
jgi:glycosyltransferase involved in cell wall biosynthesis